MSELVRKRKDCRFCHSENVTIVVPLRPVPIKTPNVGDKLQFSAPLFAPLDLYLCDRCGHLQLLDIVDPQFLYRQFAYKTAMSIGLVDHFGRMAKSILDYAKLQPWKARVVEIGSNDGTLLRYFQEQGVWVLGVDPAVHTAREATNAGINTLPEFFTYDLAQAIVKEVGLVDIVISNNTMANIDDLDDFVEGVRTLLKPDGLFVFETQYGLDVLRHVLIDTVYHEHLSYFLIRPLIGFLVHHGLELIRVEKISTKGGSIRCWAQRLGADHWPNSSVSEYIEIETDLQLADLRGYQEFNKRLDKLRIDLADALPVDHFIAGFGASVGSASLLCQLDLGRIACVVDDNPITDALYGPAGKVPVLSSSILYGEYNHKTVVILAWRYADAIIAKHQKYLDDGGCFIVPWPELKVVRRAV